MKSDKTIKTYVKCNNCSSLIRKEDVEKEYEHFGIAICPKCGDSLYSNLEVDRCGKTLENIYYQEQDYINMIERQIGYDYFN